MPLPSIDPTSPLFIASLATVGLIWFFIGHFLDK